MKASDNIFPKVLLGVGPYTVNPASGSVALFAKSTGIFYRDASGSEHAVGGGGSDSSGLAAGGMFGESEQAHGLKLSKVGVVLHSGPSGSWSENRLESPHVFWDPVIGKYRMVYLGYSGVKGTPFKASVGFATADTPEGPWTEYASNPVLAPSGTAGAPDQNGCSAPHVWFEDGVYYLFYLGLTGTGLEAGNKSICLATSTDFLTWTRLGAVILPQSGTWRANAVWHPNVVKRGSTYYLFFNANTGGESIGFATSDDLLTWVVDDANSPVMSPSSTGWDSTRIGDPYLWKKGDIWYMAYYGAGGSGTPSQEGMAWTLDEDFPLGWKKYTAFNPVIPIGGSGSYDSQSAGRGCVLVTPYRLYHWYTTGNGTGNTVEIALSVDDTLKPASTFTGVVSISAGTGIAVDNTDPAHPVVSNTGGGSGGSFVGCRAYKSTVQSIPNNVSTALTFDTEDYDTSAIHDTSTNPTRFTVPTGMTGRWRIAYHTYAAAAGGNNKIAFLRKNGGTDTNNVVGSGMGTGFNGIVSLANTVTVPLTAGDYVELFVFQNSGVAINYGEAIGANQASISFVEMQFLG